MNTIDQYYLHNYYHTKPVSATEPAQLNTKKMPGFNFEELIRRADEQERRAEKRVDQAKREAAEADAAARNNGTNPQITALAASYSVMDSLAHSPYRYNREEPKVKPREAAPEEERTL